MMLLLFALCLQIWCCTGMCTGDLHQQAGAFRRDARALKKRMWWKNSKMKLILGGIVIVILGVIALIIWVVTKPKD
jgi:hypothetical protein